MQKQERLECMAWDERQMANELDDKMETVDGNSQCERRTKPKLFGRTRQCNWTEIIQGRRWEIKEILSMRHVALLKWTT